jgi:hypothetical protein
LNQSAYPTHYNEIMKDSDFHGLTDFGRLMRAHTNYTMIKFFMAFEKTNVKMITKTSSIINNIISFSRDTLNQNKGLEMLPSEKNALR